MATLATQKGLKQYIGEQEISAGESTITFNHKDKKNQGARRKTL